MASREPRRLLRTVATAAVVSALLGASPILGWTERLPDGALASRLHQAAVLWNRTASRASLDWPCRVVRTAERRAEAWRVTPTPAP